MVIVFGGFFYYGFLCFQVFVVFEGNVVNMLQYWVVVIVKEIGICYMGQFECICGDLIGVLQVWVMIQVLLVVVLVYVNVFVFWNVGQQFDFVGFVLFFIVFLGVGVVLDFGVDSVVGVDDVFYFGFDLCQIVVGEWFFVIKIIELILIMDWVDGDFNVGLDFLNCVCYDVCVVVMDQFQCLIVVLYCVDCDGCVIVDWLL